MRRTGATFSAAEVDSVPSLEASVSHASAWFRGKRILFLVDDVWPTRNRPEGYLSDLKLLLQGSPYSRMAISSRSRLIASSIGSHVDFDAREPHGFIAVSMFMSHAVPTGLVPSVTSSSVRSILDL